MQAKILDSWVLAEFASAHDLVEATTQVRLKGYTNLDTYSPYPLHGGSEALGLTRSKVPLIALCGALTGLTAAFGMQWFMNAADYPINVGGRPLLSLPAYFPIMFELTVLLSAFGIFFGLLGLSRLPQPYHPVFENDSFRSASTHGFWLSVGHPTGTDATEVMNQLKTLGATQVSVVTGEKE
jgi:multisubunit Na+/H+ antiporter MnhG subunit